MTRCSRWFTILALSLQLLSGAGCRLGTDSPTEPFLASLAQATAPASPSGVRRFAYVDEGLYRGDQPTPEGFQQLKDMGVETVVNLRLLHGDQDKMAGTGLKYIHLRFPVWNPEDKDVLEFLKIVTTPEHKPVFVHCRLGNDRTGMMVAAYRMIIQGWPLERAMEEMEHYGYNPTWRWMENYLKDMDVEALRRKLRHADESELTVID